MEMNNIERGSLAAAPMVAAQALVDALDRIASGSVPGGQRASGHEVTA
jgi:hypothetical protein